MDEEWAIPSAALGSIAVFAGEWSLGECATCAPSALHAVLREVWENTSRCHTAGTASLSTTSVPGSALVSARSAAAFVEALSKLPRYCGLARPTGSGCASRWKSLDVFHRRGFALPATEHANAALLPTSSVTQAAAPYGALHTAEEARTEPPTAVGPQACASQGGSAQAPLSSRPCMPAAWPPCSRHAGAT